MQMNNYIVDAVDHVLNWDLPDEAIAQAVSFEAWHLAGLDSEQLFEVDVN
jgi:hypothetical protein